jgi:hypothetical protein
MFVPDQFRGSCRSRGAFDGAKPDQGAFQRFRRTSHFSIREWWSRIADAQLKMAGLPSGMVVWLPLLVNVPTLLDSAEM